MMGMMDHYQKSKQKQKFNYQTKQKIKLDKLNLIDFNFHNRILIKTNIPMKLSSPFLEYIPECKRKMRRLRKKIYKYLTSRNQTKPIHKTKDLHYTLKTIHFPLVLQQILSKKKNIDMHTVRNINISTKVSLQDMINLVNKQQSTINQEYCKWQIEEQQKERIKKESLYAKQLMSKRTISSTEQSQFGLDSYRDQSQSQNICEQYYNQMNDSSNMNGQFNPFIVQNGFLSMQSSVFSQQNLFK